MKLTVVVLAMLALALGLGFLGGYWVAMCDGWPWACPDPPPWPMY